MKISGFRECKELELKFFECPSSLFLLNGIITIMLVITSYVLARRFYSEEITILIIVFVAVVMMVISYFVHLGTTKVASSKQRLQETNNQLRVALLKLEESKTKQQEFTHFMVHDLRSPLNGIHMISDMLIRDREKKKKENLLEPLSLINESSTHMLTLVNDILDLAKIEAGMFKLEKKRNDIILFIKEIVRYFRPITESKKVKLILKSPDQLPLLEFDESAIRQVFENLISNSLKFTRPGGIIEIGLFKHHREENLNQEAKAAGINWYLRQEEEKLNNLTESIVVAITDNGGGVSFKELPRLFDKFEQMKVRMGGQDKGTGLGLVIVKGIVEAHGGRVGVSSKEGKGATFYFNLPL